MFGFRLIVLFKELNFLLTCQLSALATGVVVLSEEINISKVKKMRNVDDCIWIVKTVFSVN